MMSIEHVFWGAANALKTLPLLQLETSWTFSLTNTKCMAVSHTGVLMDSGQRYDHTSGLCQELPSNND